MVEERIAAVKQAREAAVASAGFFAFPTSTRLEAFKSSSIVAAKEAKTLSNNIDKLVKKFNIFKNLEANIIKVLSTNADAHAKITRINSLITSKGDAFKLAESLQEEKPSVLGAVSGAASATEKAMPSIAKIALGLPLLFSKEFRDIIWSGFDGIITSLESLGGAFKYTRPIVYTLTAVIAATFCKAVLMPVYTMFVKLRELGQAIGILGMGVVDKMEMAEKETARMFKELEYQRHKESRLSLARSRLHRNVELDRLQRRWNALSPAQKRDPKNIKYFRTRRQEEEHRYRREVKRHTEVAKDVRAKAGGLSATDAELRAFRRARAAKLAKIKKLKGIKSVLSRAIGFLKGGFSWTTLGVSYLIGTAIDSTAGTLIDISLDAMDDEKPELTLADGFKTFLDNLVESASFGTVEGFFRKDREKKPVATVENRPTAAPVSNTKTPEPVPTSAPIPETKSTAAAITSASVAVIALEADKAAEVSVQNIMINNVSNNLIADPAVSSSPLVFSTNVGGR